MDLSNLSLQDLRALQTDIDAQIKSRQAGELVKARQEIQAIADRLGVPLASLVSAQPGRPKNTATKTVAMQYRNPANHSQQWSGRGRQPSWVKEWVASGKPIGDLKI